MSRYFEGEATSEVGLQSGLRRDFWTAVAPDTALLDDTIKRGDRVFAAARQAARGGALGGARRDAAPAGRALPGGRAAGDASGCWSRRS